MRTMIKETYSSLFSFLDLRLSIQFCSAQDTVPQMVNGFLELAMHPAPWLCAILEDFVLVVVALI